MPYVTTATLSNLDTQIGNGQCVTLVKYFTGAPASSLWREGAKVKDLLQGGRAISTGTAIATFINGRYPNYQTGNHAAIFIRAIANGIEVFDQWKSGKPKFRKLYFGAAKSISRGSSADNYSVVL